MFRKTLGYDIIPYWSCSVIIFSLPPSSPFLSCNIHNINRSAKAAPGIATPYIMPTKEIDHTWKYLILMTDGVYKSITSVLSEQDQDSNKILTGMIRHQLGKEEPFESLAGKILSRTASIHEHCYQVNAVQDPRSALAVACRKRDDMTLLMYKFQHS